MSEVEVLPEIKQIIGAILFAAKNPVSARQIKRVMDQVAEDRGGAYSDFSSVSEADIKDALCNFRQSVKAANLGFHVAEVAGGHRLQNDVECGPWVREFLSKGRPNRLSKPALETLAIIAYRQPCVRSEIEAVRGVAVDQILRNLLEMQLVRIAGRSELPGRPMLFATTQKFLEHFGLRSLDDLPGVDELRRISRPENKEEAETEEEAEEADNSSKEGAEMEADSGNPRKEGDDD